MRNYYGGGCLDIAVDYPISDGDNVWQWACKSTADPTFPSQLWVISVQGTVPTWEGNQTAYYIRHDDTYECLDVKGQSVREGANLRIWGCKYGGNPLFY
jgi:hypothetical protein